jgi:hypothetical protein
VDHAEEVREKVIQVGVSNLNLNAVVFSLFVVMTSEHLLHQSTEHLRWHRLKKERAEHVLVKNICLLFKHRDLLDKSVIDDHQTKSARLHETLGDRQFLKHFFLSLNFKDRFYVVKHQVEVQTRQHTELDGVKIFNI